MKERLIELMQEANAETAARIERGEITDSKIGWEFLADYLLAHGVTVQRWIPASEPPKEYRDGYGELILFLVCGEGTEYPFRAMYDGKTWGDGVFAIPVKWWMPLPEAPKEEA